MISTVGRPTALFLTVLSAIGILIWMAGTFLGLFFFTDGSWGLSVPLALCAAALMAFMVYLLCRNTSLRTSSALDEAEKRRRILFGSVYGLLSLATVCFVMHAVAVTTTIRTSSRDAALADLAKIYSAIDSRAPHGSYGEYVNEEVRRYRDANSHLDAAQLRFDCSQLRQLLLQSSGFTALSDEISAAWQTQDATVRAWDLMNLPTQARAFDEAYPRWVDRLNAFSDVADRAPYEAIHKPYTFSFTPEASLHDDFSSLGKGLFSPAAIGLVLALQLLILGVWLAMFSGRGRQQSRTISAEGVTVWDDKTNRQN